MSITQDNKKILKPDQDKILVKVEINKTLTSRELEKNNEIVNLHSTTPAQETNEKIT